MSSLSTAGMGLDDLLLREWLATNQIGGYACSTAAGLNTRKYHGLLVASMSPPVRRMVLLSRVEETVIVGKTEYPLACSEYPGAIHPDGQSRLRAFSVDPFPRWAFQDDGFTIEKSLRFVPGENTVCITYTLLTGTAPVKLQLRPLMALRGMHELGFQWNGHLQAEDRTPQHHRIPPTSRTPEVFFAHDGRFDAEPGCWYMSTIYRQEMERGYAGLEDLWMPGVVRWALEPGQSVHFVCSADPIEMDRVLSELEQPAASSIPESLPEAKSDPAMEVLLHAADQFITTGPSKSAMNVISEYLWSPPSGRDAMVAFTGLLLIPRRFSEARAVLERMICFLRDGLMPSEFPEDGAEPKYLAADTSLWFINAVHDYLRYTDDHSPARDRLFDAVIRIVRSYQAGTSLGISIDPEGLVASHSPGLGTSWMNAKVGDWVITPRQGRTVELNALWYNALRIAAGLCEQFNRQAWSSEFTAMAESVRIAFNRRFWNEMNGCCFDVITDRGADQSIRPNQIFAISLPYPVLAPQRQVPVLEKVRAALLTPMGIRTLAPTDPAYQGRYHGDVVSRDRAYHQGSAYPWLLGPFTRAWIKVHGRTALARAQARRDLSACIDYLQTDGLGQLCELFDGDAPHRPGGALASARSVAQILQTYAEDILDLTPRPSIVTTIKPETLRSVIRDEKADEHIVP